MSNGELKDKTLAELQALRSKLSSISWLIRMFTASEQQKQEYADLRILLDARIAQLENAELAQIRDKMTANQSALNNAIADMQDALEDIEDVEKVLKAATQFLKVVGEVLSLVA